MIASTAVRVAQHTPDQVNSRIQEQTNRNIEYFHVHPEFIENRLEDLDREWDIERAIETWSAGLSLAGLALAATADRKWLALPIVVQLFMLQHALQGWCPPVSVLRRIGVRTAREIEDERHALLNLRASSY